MSRKKTGYMCTKLPVGECTFLENVYCGVVDVWCGGCLVWWMSDVVDVWCGGCPVWWMSFFTHGVVDVWCGGCLVWWMSDVVDEWRGGRTDGWIDRQMDGRMDR